MRRARIPGSSSAPTIPTIFGIAILATAGLAHAATVLVTGSSRGIGFEFAKQYAEAGWTVVATARDPEQSPQLKELAAQHKNVAIERLDVTDDAQIRSVATKYRGKPIDLLINNAGISGGREEQTLGTLARKAFHDVVDVNAFGALAVSQAFIENVAASQQKKIIAMTSSIGSITNAKQDVMKLPASDKLSVGPYYYRMSKAALNMAMRVLGVDVQARGVTVAVVAPGPVDTDMLRDFAKAWGVAIPGAMTPRESVGRMIPIIERLTPADAARGMNNYDGTILPW